MIPRRRHKGIEKLKAEWPSISKDWYCIYQWKPVSCSGYGETIAELILNEFSKISVNTAEVRREGFRVSNHRGQCRMSTGISQHTEKRFVRAVFNAGEIPGLGKVLDYEIPLKACQSARHGDIDLLAIDDSSAFIIEAKQVKSSESIIKALLEVYLYTALVCHSRESFVRCFDLGTRSLSPAILTFNTAQSGRQLGNWINLPKTTALLSRLNDQLADLNVRPIRFFVITNSPGELQDCLTASECDPVSSQIRFRSNFKLAVQETLVC